MAAISKKVAERLVVGIERYQAILANAKASHTGEADTVKKIRIRASVVLLVAFLSGCTTAGNKSSHPGRDSDNRPYDCTNGACAEADIQPAYNKALLTCVNMQNHYELNSNNKNVVTLVVAAVGALAGAVFAPLAKGSGTKAWAGLAGSTSAFQAQLEQQYSSLAFAQIRSAIVGEMLAGEAKFAASIGKPIDKINIANEMAMNCRSVPGEADKQIQEAISSAGQKTSASMALKVKDAAAAAAASTGMPATPSTVVAPAGATTAAPPAKSSSSQSVPL